MYEYHKENEIRTIVLFLAVNSSCFRDYNKVSKNLKWETFYELQGLS